MWSMICPQTLSKEKFKAQSRDRPPHWLLNHGVRNGNIQFFTRKRQSCLYSTFKFFVDVLKARNVIFDMSSNIIKREIQSAK